MSLSISRSRALAAGVSLLTLLGLPACGAAPVPPADDSAIPVQEWKPAERGETEKPKDPKPTEPEKPRAGQAAKLELVDPDRVVEVKRGDVATFTLVNTGDTPYVYHHPGGSSGCAGFRWDVTLVDTKTNDVYPDPSSDPRLMCTAVMIPPRDIVFAPHEPVEVKVDTSAPYAFSFGGPPASLARSTYDVVIAGADASFRARLIVR